MNTTYVVYQLDSDKRAPSVEQQLAYIRQAYKKKYGNEPTDLIRGPAVLESNLIVNESYVYIILSKTES